MSFKSGQGATIAIGTILATPNHTLAEYQADTYVTIGGTDKIGAFGDERNIVKFITLADGRVQKLRGSVDGGDQAVSYGDITGDEGQLAMESAFAATSHATDEFNFRVTLNDQIATNPTRYYYRAKITTLRPGDITNDGVVMIDAVLAITTGFTKQAAT